MTQRTVFHLAAAFLLAVTARADQPRVDFVRDVAPILEQHCLHCHSDNISKGEISLSRGDQIFDQEYVLPGDPDGSYLVELISGDDPEMPKEGKRLTSQQVDLIRHWITQGASWAEDTVLHERSKSDTSWWSLQPLGEVASGSSIDTFVESRLAQQGLSMSEPADQRSLIRRATYDLTGLPPTPQQVRDFVEDTDPNAYEKLIDRLLSSPHYGQRWGRHWLDVVRFGESNGYERNQIIQNLWPFRDYVIRSFNEDKPFDRLIREHLAGDVIAPNDPEAVIGTAFLVAGPYDDVGNQDPAQKLQIRANTIDEMIRTTGEAFLGLTIGCARCHDHKFDPVLQRDYYQMYATFAGVQHGSDVVATADEKARRAVKVAPLNQRKQKLTAERNRINEEIARRAQEKADQLQTDWTRPPVDRAGTEERFEPVQARFVRLVCEGLDTNPKASSGFRIDELEVWSAEPSSRNVALASHGARAFGPSRVIEDFPGAYGPQLAIDGNSGARFISTSPYLTIELAQETPIDRVVFSSARDELRPEQGKFVFVSDYRIEVSSDGESWQAVADGRDRKPVNETHRLFRLQAMATTAEERSELARLDRELKAVTREINAISPLRSVWVGTRDAEGAEGPFHVFVGGSPQRPGTEVTPASLSSLTHATQPYDLGRDSSEKARRVALADWMVDPANPLTPRVLANRLWHYHFGTGIVSTPSDLGYMGGRPSHPKLLDYLAVNLVEGGWRLKRMHKLIMMSRAYRQSSRFREDAARQDRDNRLLWRFPPRRLAAEEIRDTMLFVSGQLDTRMGGPGFRLYRYLQDNVATYVPLDTHDQTTYRRSVYHQNARATRIDLMTDFDQPDCAFSTARRAETTTPLQALTTLNHAFTMDMARSMADRLTRHAPEDPEAQLRVAFEICFSRQPSERELRETAAFLNSHDLTALCRLLLNTSELIYVL